MKTNNFTGVNHYNDTTSRKVLPSGWNNKYWVLFEDAEYEEHKAELLTKEQIFREYGIDVNNITNNLKIEHESLRMEAIEFLTEKHHNDMELGCEVRKFVNIKKYTKNNF
jgi:hypothetical protein